MTKDKTTKSGDQPDKLQGIARGIATGVLVPLATVPIDQVQTNRVVNGNLTFKKLYELFRQQPATTSKQVNPFRHPLKAYPLTAGTNVFRYTIMYGIEPPITAFLNKQGLTENYSQTFGFIIAGGLDGIFSAPTNVAKQKMYTSSQTSVIAVLRNTSCHEMLYKSMISSRYIILRNTVFWPAYNNAVKFAESHVDPKKQANPFMKSVMQFGTGAIAGVAATGLSYPFDAIQKYRVQNPSLTVKTMVANGWKQHGATSVYKTFYRGYPITLFRMPVACAMLNVTKNGADTVYDYMQKRKA